MPNLLDFVNGYVIVNKYTFFVNHAYLLLRGNCLRIKLFNKMF